MVMYQEHFGLKRPPFSMHPDPAFLYLSEQHSSAKAFLESSALVNDSFVVITGSIGAGKTTLVEGFVAELPEESTVIARINQTQLSATGFLRLLLADLGLDAFKSKKPELLARLSGFLGRCSSEGKSVVVVIDEAQNLAYEVLEEVRLLTGSRHAACLTVVLVGQPEFLDMLESPKLRQLAQRCRLRSHLAALDEGDTQKYVTHRLAIAGAGDNNIFTEDALAEIHASTRGIPRLINNLCDTALICAFADGLQKVDANVMLSARNELGWDKLRDRRVAPDSAPASGSQKGQAAVSTAPTDAAAEAALAARDERIKALELALKNAESARDRPTLAEKALPAERANSGDYSQQTKRVLESQQRLSELHDQLAALMDNRAAPEQQEVSPDVSELTENLALLESQLDVTDGLLAELERTASDEREKMTSGEQRIAALEQDLAAKADELEILREKLQDAAAKAQGDDELADRLSTGEAAVADLQAANDTLTENLAQANETLRLADARTEELANALNAAMTESDAAAKANEQLSADLEQASGDLEAAVRKVASHEAALDQYGREIATLTKARDELQASLEDARSDLDGAADREKDLQETETQNHARLTELETKVSARDHSIKTLEAEVRRKNKLIDELHDKLKPLPELISEIEVLVSENNELQHDVESKIHRIAELEEALSLSQQRLDDARHEIDNSNNQHVGLHKEIAEYKSQLAELKDGTSQRDDLVKSLHVECQNRKQDLRRLRSELDESLDQARELRDSVEVGESRARGLEDELAAALETIREMNESGFAASTEAREIGEQLTQRQQEIDALEAELRDKESTLVSMATTLKEKTETIKVLELDAEASEVSSVEEARQATTAAQDQLVKQLRREVEARDRCIDDLELALNNSSESMAELTRRLEQQEKRSHDLEEQLESTRAAAADLREEAGRTDREFDETSVIPDKDSESTSMSVRLQTLGAGLLISTNGHPAKRVPLRSERLIIGRTRDSDIKIDNEFASRHHAQIVYDNGTFFVEDLSSTNGIFVNSRRVKRRRLRNRDIISIGRDKLIFVQDDQPAKREQMASGGAG